MLKNVLIGTGVVVVATGIVAVRVHNKNIHKKIDNLNEEFQRTLDDIDTEYITDPDKFDGVSKYEKVLKAQEEYDKAFDELKAKFI